MTKYYPPSIPGALPAFYGEYLTVPFTMSRAVSQNSVYRFAIKIKTVQSNRLICSMYTDDINYETGEARFYVKDYMNSFVVGRSYKVQIAYESRDGVVGYYSSVGVIKYTIKPKVFIEGLELKTNNSNLMTYTGHYLQDYPNGSGDISEKVYSYCFTVWNSDGEIVATTENKIHNHETDDEIYESYDIYDMDITLKDGENYFIQYSVITTNGLKESSPKYRIVSQNTVAPEIKADLVVIMNDENGYMTITLQGEKNNGVESVAIGTFLISRSSSEDDFSTWHPVLRFALNGERPSKWIWKDFTIQHGYFYQYALQQYNQETGLYSDKIYSDKIQACFEDAFLFDGERQLRIRFNPKVTSFKQDVLETKTNTLGAKYPFIFRNGNVSYKEFPIAGLISYQMDNEELFIDKKELGFKYDLKKDFTRFITLNPDIKATDEKYFNSLDVYSQLSLQQAYKNRDSANGIMNILTSNETKMEAPDDLKDHMVLAERIFKLKVLEFLTDGKPKLFRSPSEGNYLVRLMNVSLSPEDKLGRMLHSFTSTAYEIAESNYFNLNDSGIIKISEPEVMETRWETIELAKITKRTKLNQYPAYSIDCKDMAPGDQIAFGESASNCSIITIGMTGAYKVNFETPINYIGFISQIGAGAFPKQGLLTYSYKSPTFNQFNTYKSVINEDIPLKQYYGSVNVFEDLEDLKHKITGFYLLHFSRREVQTIYADTSRSNGGDPVYYTSPHAPTQTEESRNKLEISPVDPLILYKVYKIGDVNNDFYYIDGRTRQNIGKQVSYKIYINDKEIDLTDRQMDYELRKPQGITKLIVSNGIVSDIVLQRKEIVYTVEETNATVAKNKSEYLSFLDQLKRFINSNEATRYVWPNAVNPSQTAEYLNTRYNEEFETLRKTKNTSYQKFLDSISKALDGLKKEALENG